MARITDKAGYTRRNSGEARVVVDRGHNPTSGDDPLWAWIEANGWKRKDAEGEWEFRRYTKAGKLAIFFIRANGNMTTAGYSANLFNAYHAAIRAERKPKEAK